MATDEGSGAPASRNPDPIPTTIVFAESPGIGGILIVDAEHGDIVIHVELTGQPFCACVLTMDNALTLSMWLCAHIVDERRRRRL